MNKDCLNCGHSILEKISGQLYCTIKHKPREHLRKSKKGKYWIQFSKACKYFIDDAEYQLMLKNIKTK